MNRRWLAISAVAVVTELSAVSARAQCGPSGVDADGDGLDDGLEVCGIPLLSGATVTGDPARKDLFVILAPASSGSLLPTGFNPYLPATFIGSGVSVTYNGLAALGLNVHVVGPGDLQPDRTIIVGAGQKAVRIAESTDTNGTILGNCQWGTPDGLDGCVVYTQRIKNFIDTNCAGNTDVERALMFNAYIVESFLHETGHSLGGLTSDYNSRFGGYHYKPGSALVMEQSITYSAKGGKCTWNMSSGWNPTLDVPAIRLQ